jgi:hypothetical protein
MEVTVTEVRKPTKTYYVRDGNRHGNGADPETGVRRYYEAGDAVELTATQYEAFRDKFETAEEHDARVRRPKAPAAASPGTAEAGNKAGATQTVKK